MQLQRVKLSRAEYARRRGVAKSTVSRQCASGLIPVGADGLIDPIKADRALAKRRVKAALGGSLAEARRAKLAAGVVLLEADVAAYANALISPGDAQQAFAEIGEATRARFERLVAEVAPLVAGLEAPEVFRVLTDHVHAALTELSSTLDPEDNEAAVEPAKRARRRPTATALAARKATLQARRLELRGAFRRGDVVERVAVDELVHRRLYAVRAAALAVPTKLAPLFEGADSARARLILADEVDEVLDDLEQPLAADLGPPPLRGDPRPWQPHAVSDDSHIDWKELERERAERFLNACYRLCCSLACEDVPYDRAKGMRHPRWADDWPFDRPDWWRPPPGLIEDMRSTWFSPSCQPYGYDARAREFMAHYDPDQGWPWRVNEEMNSGRA